MKLFKIALVAIVFLVNLAIAQPSWADSPNLTETPDYIEVTQAINKLLQAKDNSGGSSNRPEEIQLLGELKLQKYILETAQDWGQCRNETDKTLAVYAHKPKKSSVDQQNTLFFLGKGQLTDDDWNCDGVYLPSGVKVTGLTPAGTQVQELTQPLALKLVPGTQLVAKTNPQTDAVEFNITPAKVFKVGEGNWSIPYLSLADIDTHVPNAPIED